MRLRQRGCCGWDALIFSVGTNSAPERKRRLPLLGIRAVTVSVCLALWFPAKGGFCCQVPTLLPGPNLPKRSLHCYKQRQMPMDHIGCGGDNIIRLRSRPGVFQHSLKLIPYDHADGIWLLA